MVTAEGATAGAGVGGTARGGGRRGDVSGRVADADERADEGVALAGGDDDDGGVDRRASGDGHARLSEPSLVSPEEAGR